MKRLLPIALLLATPAFADDAGLPSFFVEATGGYSVYKSALVQSNDTAVTVGYGFGVNGGKAKEIGMVFRRERSAFAFTLNESKLALQWQDVILKYRLGPFHMGAVVSESSWVASAPPDADGDDILDTGTDAQDLLALRTFGYGGNTGLSLSVHKRALVFADVSYVTSGETMEAVVEDAAGAPILGRVITMGPRLDADFGGNIKLTRKSVDAKVGFRYRTFLPSIDGVAYQEQMTTTYVGVAYNLEF